MDFFVFSLAVVALPVEHELNVIVELYEVPGGGASVYLFFESLFQSVQILQERKGLTTDFALYGFLLADAHLL